MKAAWSAARTALCGAVFLVACGRPPHLAWAPPLSVARPPSAPIVVLGDTQRALWEEQVLAGREQNEAPRRALLERVALEQPAFVVHLGDMVAWGASNAEWNYFDRLVSPLAARGIRIFPALGNHEGYGSERAARRNAERSARQNVARAARRNVFRRFPELMPSGYYSLRHRHLGLIWLDTNLRGSAGDEQARWFAATVDAFEGNPEVSAVLVFAHHPAHTSAKDRHADPYLAAKILPCFESAAKTRVFFSGHVHGYERYEIVGKQFVVSGGGGGPRSEFVLGPADGPRRFFPVDAGVSPFHYVVIRERPNGLDVSAKCLGPHPACVNGTLDSFLVEFPPARVASGPPVCQRTDP